MIPKVHKQGSSTLGLLHYLYGPGKAEAHIDAHLVASHDGTAPDPGRDPTATRADLRDLLDQPLHLLEADQRPAKHVWHCSVRAASGDRILTDTQWAQIARRIVAATGIAPEGDGAGCRWAAVRHADDHIHIIATLVREDGRRPNHHRSGQRAQAECRRIETDFGLTRVNAGDGTAAKRATSAERHKADRQGKAITPRDELRAIVRTAAAHATSEADFFAKLAGSHVLVNRRIAPSGDVIGLKVAIADNRNKDGQPVWFAGGTLAKDLTWPKIRERITAHNTAPNPPSRARTGRASERWRHTTRALQAAHTSLHGDNPALAQAQLLAVGDLLDILPTVTTGPTRVEIFTAAQHFERATRSRVRFDYAQAAKLRTSAKCLLRTAGQPVPDAPVLDLLLTLTLLAIAAARWHRAQRHTQQATAARAALSHLRAAYRHTAAPALNNLAKRAPAREVAEGYVTAVRDALPDHAEQILTDPAWPALAATLHESESEPDGHRPANVLSKTVNSRELDTADSVAEVLIWRLRNVPGRHSRRVEATQTRTTRAERQRHVEPSGTWRPTAPPLSPSRPLRQR